MNSISVDLFQSADAESFAIRLPSDPPGTWRAELGCGGQLKKVWSVEYQTLGPAPDWNSLLTRTVKAWQLSDPIVTMM